MHEVFLGKCSKTDYFFRLVLKSKLPPRSGSSLQAVQPHLQKKGP